MRFVFPQKEVGIYEIWMSAQIVVSKTYQNLLSAEPWSCESMYPGPKGGGWIQTQIWDNIS